MESARPNAHHFPPLRSICTSGLEPLLVIPNNDQFSMVRLVATGLVIGFRAVRLASLGRGTHGFFTGGLLTWSLLRSPALHGAILQPWGRHNKYQEEFLFVKKFILLFFFVLNSFVVFPSSALPTSPPPTFFYSQTRSFYVLYTLLYLSSLCFLVHTQSPYPKCAA